MLPVHYIQLFSICITPLMYPGGNVICKATTTFINCKFVRRTRIERYREHGVEHISVTTDNTTDEFTTTH